MVWYQRKKKPMVGGGGWNKRMTPETHPHIYENGTYKRQLPKNHWVGDRTAQQVVLEKLATSLYKNHL